MIIMTSRKTNLDPNTPTNLDPNTPVKRKAARPEINIYMSVAHQADMIAARLYDSFFCNQVSIYTDRPEKSKSLENFLLKALEDRIEGSRPWMNYNPEINLFVCTDAMEEFVNLFTQDGARFYQSTLNISSCAVTGENPEELEWRGLTVKVYLRDIGLILPRNVKLEDDLSSGDLNSDPEDTPSKAAGIEKWVREVLVSSARLRRDLGLEVVRGTRSLKHLAERVKRTRAEHNLPLSHQVCNKMLLSTGIEIEGVFLHPFCKLPLSLAAICDQATYDYQAIHFEPEELQGFKKRGYASRKRDCLLYTSPSPRD